MGKDPAFLFYPGDWLSGTIGMTLEEKGAYMELLMAQFSRGHMTEHMIGRIVGQHWVNIKDKFAKDENGLYYNKRLEEEIDKRKKYVKSRKNNVSGANQYTKNKENKVAHMNGHMSSHMENENENKDIDVIELNTLPMFDKITNIDFLQMCRKVSDQKGRLTDLDQYKKEYFRLLANRKELHEQSGRSEEWLVINAKKFIKEQAAINKEYDNYADFFSHFLNWTRKQPK